MNLFDDNDCLSFAEAFAKKAFYKYSTISDSTYLSYEDIFHEAVLVLWELRKQSNINDTKDCGPYCWKALKRRFYKLLDSVPIVKFPDYRSKYYNKELAGFYLAGNYLPLFSEEGACILDSFISLELNDFDFVENKILIDQLIISLSEDDKEELYRLLFGLKPKSRKRRSTLTKRCRDIFEGHNPYKTKKNKYPGVEQVSKNRWRAYKIVNRKKVVLGRFSSPEEAYALVLQYA